MTAPKTDLSELKVLIVDDMPEARAMIKHMLVNMGITQIFEAGDGREGLRFMDFDFNFVDIVLCDWNMPQMDGLALLRQLRSVDPDFPFMMITGRNDLDSVSQAKGAGVSGYILKPFSLTQLEAKLRIVAARAKKIA